MKKLIPILFCILLAGCQNVNRESSIRQVPGGIHANPSWPVLHYYDQGHLLRVAMPLGGIGTGTVSLGGRGDLCDWEIMNRPSKGFTPAGMASPFFCLYTESGGKRNLRVLEGQLDKTSYEGSHGSTAPNAGLPRFSNCSFSAAYPMAQVFLYDPDVPLQVRLEAFNPLIPADDENSGIPVAILRYVLENNTGKDIVATVCGSLPNFIGNDGYEKQRNWCGDFLPTGENNNVNRFLKSGSVQGIMMESKGVDPKAEQWGTIALVTDASEDVTYRTGWKDIGWNTGILGFWDDLSADGKLNPEGKGVEHNPMASLAVQKKVPAHGEAVITFVLGWHFPNRFTWTKHGITTSCCGTDNGPGDCIGNYYATKYSDAWDVAEKVYPRIDTLEKATLAFDKAFCDAALPPGIKEAALFNLSTLRSQTCFRTPDKRFYGWEGTCNQQGCCNGSCTHVWNYEQATAFLFGNLSQSMREVEFGWATDKRGLMSFRVNLPLKYANEFNRAAADGQMGCIMKMYRDWQLSGNDSMLRSLWPGVKRALAFCWIPGGWDANKDGVMEGCQHNTMDVEYYGPNPQMEFWYLGALTAAAKMALYLGEKQFADSCVMLAKNGRAWTDQHLFNGEYYIQQIQPPSGPDAVAEGLRVGMGATDVVKPDFQLGQACLVDQLVGQFMAHICGLGYLGDSAHIKKTLESILKYNSCSPMQNHFNNMRSFAMGGESALLMAAYPKERPEKPFPYFNEVMTGFEYAAAVGMMYENMIPQGLKCVSDIRDRYDGLKRNPFDEAECGHHYARAMASWGAINALTGFQYSGVNRSLQMTPQEGTFFWSNGYAWGTCKMEGTGKHFRILLSVLGGELKLERFELAGKGFTGFEKGTIIRSGETRKFEI